MPKKTERLIESIILIACALALFAIPAIQVAIAFKIPVAEKRFEPTNGVVSEWHYGGENPFFGFSPITCATAGFDNGGQWYKFENSLVFNYIDGEKFVLIKSGSNIKEEWFLPAHPDQAIHQQVYKDCYSSTKYLRSDDSETWQKVVVLNKGGDIWIKFADVGSIEQVTEKQSLWKTQVYIVLYFNFVQFCILHFSSMGFFILLVLFAESTPTISVPIIVILLKRYIEKKEQSK